MFQSEISVRLCLLVRLFLGNGLCPIGLFPGGLGMGLIDVEIIAMGLYTIVSRVRHRFDRVGWNG